MKIYEVKKNIVQLSSKIGDIQLKAMSESRDLTNEETGLIAEMDDYIEELRKHLPERALTLQNRPLMDGAVSAETGKGYALKGPKDKKDYKSLYGSTNRNRWEEKESSFFSAVFSGRHHPGLIKAGMSETVPSDGGFLVPSQLAEQIHNVALESEIIMPRAFVQPMKSNECNIPAMTIGDHSANLYGGFTASYVAEAATISEADPKTRNMKLIAKKLTGMLRFSSELAADIPGGENQIIKICGHGLAWYRDKAFLKGTGAGEPLGILLSLIHI